MLNQPELFATQTDNRCPALEQEMVLLDLETTGASAARDRIIEIGLVHFKQFQVIDQWSTLVNPGVQLSAFIEDYTGINQQMVASAPSFAAVAEQLRQHLDRGLLVAHNARFDYSFLQKEYARIGISYQAASLCTVKLSRKLFPEVKRHNLDAVIDRHNLRCDSRHRALDDAIVLAGFLSDLPRLCAAKEIEQAINDQL